MTLITGYGGVEISIWLIPFESTAPPTPQICRSVVYLTPNSGHLIQLLLSFELPYIFMSVLLTQEFCRDARMKIVLGAWTADLRCHDSSAKCIGDSSV